MPTMSALLALGPAIAGPKPTGPALRPGTPAGVPWRRLVAEQYVGPSAVTLIRGGVAVHALDLPASWLAFPIVAIGSPVSPPV
jgi:hypothetical protein